MRTLKRKPSTAPRCRHASHQAGVSRRPIPGPPGGCGLAVSRVKSNPETSRLRESWSSPPASFSTVVSLAAVLPDTVSSMPTTFFFRAPPTALQPMLRRPGPRRIHLKA